MALQLFPLEVWEVIVAKINVSDDVWNLMTAFPALSKEAVIRKQFPFWFFEMSIQCICERLSKGENRSLRLVCKKWRDGIDRFIQCHPEKDKKVGEIRDYDQFPSYFPLISKSPHGLFGEFRFIETLTDQSLLMEEFGKDIDSCFSASSPFFMKELTFLPDMVIMQREYGGDISQYYDQSKTLIERFGNQLHFLNLYGANGDDEGIIRYILGLLCHTVNVKRLKLGAVGLGLYDIPMGSYAMTCLVSQLITELPVLPNLVSIEIRGYDLPSEFVTLLVTHFSSQLQRLVINADYWEQAWGSSLSSLMSFGLVEGNMEKTIAVLDSISSTHIKLVSLDVQNFRDDEKDNLHSSAIMITLSTLKNMEEIHIYSSYGCFLDKCNVKTLSIREHSTKQITSVRRLELCYSALALSIPLLWFFPRVEYIRVCFPHFKSPGIYSRYCNLLWNDLTPNLKAVAVDGWDKNGYRLKTVVVCRTDWERCSKFKKNKIYCNSDTEFDTNDDFFKLWK